MEIVKGWSGIGCRCWIVAKSFIEITSILYSIQKLFKVWKGKYQQKALIQWAFVEGRLEENEFLGLNGSKKSWLLPSLYFIHHSFCINVPHPSTYNVIEKASPFHKLWNQMTEFVFGRKWVTVVGTQPLKSPLTSPMFFIAVILYGQDWGKMYLLFHAHVLKFCSGYWSFSEFSMALCHVE